MTKAQLLSLLARTFDAIERWMLGSGLLDQLSFLVAKTTLLRMVILSAATSYFGAAAVQGQIGQALVGAAVAAATGSVSMFIDHVRRKYNAQTLTLAQVAAPEVGVKVDDFVGPKAVAALELLAARR